MNTKMTRHFAVLTLAIAIALPTLAQTGGGCVALAVGSQEKGKGALDTEFSATQILDVDFSILFTPGSTKRFGGTHVAEVRVFSPSGNLYQSIAIPFSSDSALIGSKAPLQGYPDPVVIRQVSQREVKGAKHPEVQARMPVAGTLIVTNSLYGTWTAEAFVDGDPLPCSKKASFRITE